MKVRNKDKGRWVEIHYAEPEDVITGKVTVAYTEAQGIHIMISGIDPDLVHVDQT